MADGWQPSSPMNPDERYKQIKERHDREIIQKKKEYTEAAAIEAGHV